MMPRVSPLPGLALLCCITLVSCSKSQRITGPVVDAAREGGAARAKAGIDDVPLLGHTFTPGSSNPYFPLVPGTAYHYRGRTKDGIETEVFQVLHQTQVVQGVTTQVIQDDVWLDGVLIEHTLDWFAQDEDGNVWYFGEDVTNTDPVTGVSDHDGSWEAGVAGAQAGIIMLAHPAVGDAYFEENAGAVARDHAAVLALDGKVNTPDGRFKNCLRTENTTPLEPAFLENKFYAAGVGLVMEINVTDKERNELVDVTGPGIGDSSDKKNAADTGNPGVPRRADAE